MSAEKHGAALEALRKHSPYMYKEDGEQKGNGRKTEEEMGQERLLKNKSLSMHAPDPFRHRARIRNS